MKTAEIEAIKSSLADALLQSAAMRVLTADEAQWLAHAAARNAAAKLPEPDPDDALYTLYDAASRGECSLMLWEHQRPGALEALYRWAEDTGRRVVVRDSSDAGAVVHAVEMFKPVHDVISVYVRVDRTHG